MNILVTLNSGYIKPLCTMLKSLAATHPQQMLDLYVAHSSLTELDFKMIENALSGSLSEVHSIKLGDNLFENAPTKKRISKETYYRVFAPLYLPESVERILYIDPDTIILNSLNPFYSAGFGDSLIIGAKHFDGVMDIWNRGRLGIIKSKRYINAGIMLLNDGKIDIFTEYKINLDERTFKHLLEKSSLEESLKFVERNTMIVHYNGKNKPWNDKYNGYLKGFYDHYSNTSQERIAYEKGA